MPVPHHTAELLQDLPHGSLEHALLLVRPLFDALFYAEQYRDVPGDSEALLLHFCGVGWKEGRNPNAGFDTVFYLKTHADVAQIGWNPFYHYVLAGHAEYRLVAPAPAPRAAAEAFFGHDPGDWVTLLRPDVDDAFYAKQLGPAADGSFDLAAHFAYRGWQEGLSPNRSFDVVAALRQRPELLAAQINPLLATLVEQPKPATPAPVPPEPDYDDPAITTTRFPREALFGITERLQALTHGLAEQRADGAPSYEDPVERVVAEHLDRAFYLASYADVSAHGTDPVEHYCRIGWTEARRPAVGFDTGFYLRNNPDVAASGVNPFWHYLVAGRHEGRKAQRPGGYRRDIIEHAVDPDTRTRGYSRAEPVGLLTRARLDRLLNVAWSARGGLVISVSHDCYVRVTGGIQLFIADEQARFAGQGLAYVHISPFTPLLRLADRDASKTLVNLVIDGRFAGITSYVDLAAAFARREQRQGERRLFLVHCLLGHHLPDLIELQRACASSSNIFWVHDYSSICIGYTLLRNDVEYCHAPPPDSMACRVCVYGEHRGEHLAEIRALFEAVPFHVVAPSQAALAIWQAHSGLPHLSAAAHEHCDVIPSDEPVPEREDGQPVRVAFIGYARAHKGWPLWTELVSRTRRLGAYDFYHLGSAETAADSAGLRHYVVSTSPAQPEAMADAVRDLEIDLVLVLSTWPETFSYVTYEALAGGADVVCLQDSGNVADTVLRRGRGIVAADEESLFAFFTSLRAVEYVRLCREQALPLGELVREGTTATLPLVQA